jgi:integration host factor subunit beta
MQTITKRELVQRIAEKTGVQQISAKEVIQSFLDEIINELARGNRLEFRDFGVFEPKSKAQRVARNPRTGEKVDVPEKTTVKFKVGRLMKKRIQNEEVDESDYDRDDEPVPKPGTAAKDPKPSGSSTGGIAKAPPGGAGSGASV